MLSMFVLALAGLTSAADPKCGCEVAGMADSFDVDVGRGKTGSASIRCRDPSHDKLNLPVGELTPSLDDGHVTT
jgi:hypothetical protein